MTTWNPADKSASITLSNGNLTSSCSSNVDGGVRSTASKSSGKIYFEFTASNMNGSNTGVGLATATASLTTLGPSITGGLMIYQSGSIYFNGSDTGLTISNGIGGQTISIAIDIGASRFWARGNSGSWNTQTTSSADPATGVGGINIAALFPSNAVFVAATPMNTAASLTVNFGTTAFVRAIPSGFSRWDTQTVFTNAQVTQAAVEHWGPGAPAAQITQTGLEVWGAISAVSRAALITQLAVEEWASVPLPPVTASQTAVSVNTG